MFQVIFGHGLVSVKLDIKLASHHCISVSATPISFVSRTNSAKWQARSDLLFIDTFNVSYTFSRVFK